MMVGIKRFQILNRISVTFLTFDCKHDDNHLMEKSQIWIPTKLLSPVSRPQPVCLLNHTEICSLIY